MKYGCLEKLRWLWLFVAVLALSGAVKASFYLPESSLWQGYREYNQDNVDAYVEYAVYDTKASTYHPTLDGQKDGFASIGSGRYIYAYQIFDVGANLPAIAMFQLLGGNSTSATGIGSKDDGHNGLIPSNDGSSFVWTFDAGVFVQDQHSAYLIFSSDYSPVAGTLNLSTESGQEPPTNGGDNNHAPEPATIALLAVGVWRLIGKKKAYCFN